jgi:hypothetical protein
MTLHNDQGYIKQLEKSHARYFQQLPIETQQSLQYYSGEGYQSINDYLRGLPVHPDSGSPEAFIQMIKNHIARIEKALIESPPLTKAIEVYRGVRLPESTRYNVGDIVNLFQNGFTSTSFNVEVSAEFAGDVCCLFVLYLPPETRGLYLGTRSTRGTEYEYLLAPGTSFKIVKKGSETVQWTSTTKKRLMTYHAHCFNCEFRLEPLRSQTAENIDTQFLKGLSSEVIGEVNRLSSQCEKRNYLLNPRTNRCVRIDGVTGQSIIKELIQHQ